MANHNSHQAIASKLHDLSSLTKIFIIGLFFIIINFGPRLLPTLVFNNHYLLSICITLTFFTNLVTEIIIYYQKHNNKDFHQVLGVQIIFNTILLMAFLALIDHINGPLFLICTLTLMESFLNLNLRLPTTVIIIMAFSTLFEWVYLVQTNQLDPSIFNIVTLGVRIMSLIFLMSYGKSLAKSIIAAREVDRMKDEFLSIASHELRTPMTIIKSYIAMALDKKYGPLTPDQNTYLSRALSSTDRLIKLVNDLLNISRIEADRFVLKFQDVNLRGLIDEIIEETMPKFLENKIKLIYKPTINPQVIADPDKIREVILNLLGNSIKFTPPNGKISISIAKVKDETVVSLTDTGAGIEKKHLDTLFQKFGLINDSYVVTKTTSSGTGLGLYICKSFINLHHGLIWAKSAGTNKGTTINFTLKNYSPSNLKEFKIDPLTKKES